MITATYKCMIGERKRNLLIKRAGLGITGAFSPIRYEIKWEEGTIVDKERAEKAGQVLKDGLNSIDGVECSSVELVFLT